MPCQKRARSSSPSTGPSIARLVPVATASLSRQTKPTQSRPLPLPGSGAAAGPRRDRAIWMSSESEESASYTM